MILRALARSAIYTLGTREGAGTDDAAVCPSVWRQWGPSKRQVGVAGTQVATHPHTIISSLENKTGKKVLYSANVTFNCSRDASSTV